MEIVLFTLVAIGLYLTAEAILRAMEARRGAPFLYRTLIFFALLLGLALPVFALICRLLGT